jgi:hypothetical protein
MTIDEYVEKTALDIARTMTNRDTHLSISEDIDIRKNSLRGLMGLAGKNKPYIIDCVVAYVRNSFDGMDRNQCCDLNTLEGVLNDFGIKLKDLSKENLAQLIDMYRTSPEFVSQYFYNEATDLLKMYAKRK